MSREINMVRLDTSLELLVERMALIQTRCVVATVIAAIGSTYRKPGARMLVEGDGRITGLLSGGCFEQDLREHANKVLASNEARTVAYDMRDDNDLIFGIGAGCEGRMDILLEPAEAGTAASNAILQATSLSHLGRSVALATLYTAPAAELGTRLWHADLEHSVSDPLAVACARAVEHRQSQTFAWNDSGVLRETWIQVVMPPPAVLICGAGADTEPLVTGLLGLRYPVTLVDHRPAYAQDKRFAGATVICKPAASLSSAVELQSFFAAVVMSHHLESDAAYLRALSASDIPYIGLLGPKARRERLLGELGEAAGTLQGRLRSPIGLDIGAVTPEGIALAILAEVHAAAAGRSGSSITTR